MNDRLLKIWREWRGFVLFVAVMLVFRSAIADWNQVPSGSMKPSILDGDRIVVDKLAYDLRVPFTLTRLAQWSDPERGDVVTFPNPEDDRLFVKRVVGIPGDVVEMRRNQLIINGEKATYTPLSTQEVAELPIAGAKSYRFFYEDVLGSKRIVMLNAYSDARWSTFGPHTIAPGRYWMMGDNRDNSRDSRAEGIGLIDRERIVGRAHAIAFSVDYDQYYAPRLERFFTDLP